MIDPGLYARVVFQRHAADIMPALATTNTVRIALEFRRELRPEVTPLHSDVFRYAPDAQSGILRMAGFIDRSVEPGWLNDVEAIVTVQPNLDQANKFIRFNAWVEKFEWDMRVDDANRFTAVVYPTGTPTYSWL